VTTYLYEQYQDTNIKEYKNVISNHIPPNNSMHNDIKMNPLPQVLFTTTFNTGLSTNISSFSKFRFFLQISWFVSNKIKQNLHKIYFSKQKKNLIQTVIGLYVNIMYELQKNWFKLNKQMSLNNACFVSSTGPLLHRAL
jgi:hypothetical protein